MPVSGETVYRQRGDEFPLFLYRLNYCFIPLQVSYFNETARIPIHTKVFYFPVGLGFTQAQGLNVTVHSQRNRIWH